MIWKQEFTLDGLQNLNQNTLGEVLGIEFTEIGSDYLIATMPVSKNTRQPMGLLHGGASAALAETLGSFSSVLCIADITKNQIVGTELSITHLRSARSGLVTGICKPIKVGRKVHVWEIKIYNDQEKLISISRLTTMII